MNCQIAQERIVAADYGELAEEQALELERHLDGCAECRKEQAGAHCVGAWLRPIADGGAAPTRRGRSGRRSVGSVQHQWF